MQFAVCTPRNALRKTRKSIREECTPSSRWRSVSSCSDQPGGALPPYVHAIRATSVCACTHIGAALRKGAAHCFPPLTSSVPCTASTFLASTARAAPIRRPGGDREIHLADGQDIVGASEGEVYTRDILPGTARMLDLDTFYLGPFTKIAGNPVLGPRPRAESNFSCPWHNSVVGWEEKDIFNPAAIVKDGRVHLLYRAEDNVGAFAGTSRIGLATSSTGLEFKAQDRRGAPVLYPAPLERDCCTKAAKQSNLCEVRTHARTKARARAHTHLHTYARARKHTHTHR